jgi:hypothetical protein
MRACERLPQKVTRGLTTKLPFALRKRVLTAEKKKRERGDNPQRTKKGQPVLLEEESG